MCTILVHIGCSTGPFITTTHPPVWLQYAIKQYFMFNDSPLYVMTDRENIPYLPEGVIPVALEDYHSAKIARFNAVYEHADNDFWTAAATRFFYLESFMREQNLTQVYHFDNDVMIYFNLADYHDTFKRLYDRIAITPENFDKALAGFMYIANAESLSRVTDFFIDELERYGERGLWGKYKTDIIHEMLLIAGCKKERGGIDYLPVLPFGEASWNFDKFDSIFDPIGWGEYVDGNIQGDPVPYRTPWSYIGKLLLKHPDYGVVWGIENGLEVPYFSYDGNLVRINNLHIHSKNLQRFLSR